MNGPASGPHRCLVTGAGGGIGAAIAIQLSSAGHQVALAGRDRDKLEKVASDLPGPHLVLPGDLCEPSALDQVLTAVNTAWGPIEVLAMAAGISSSAPLARTSDEEWSAALEVNLNLPFRLMRLVTPAMMSAGWGRIIAIASTAAKRGEPYLSAYTASKHGLLGLVRSVAAEVAATGVTVNAICPGFVDTPMTETSAAWIRDKTGRTIDQARELLAGMQPIGRLVDPAEVADAVLMCLQNAAINGQGITIDGGSVQS